jgi:hypothetical protein
MPSPRKTATAKKTSDEPATWLKKINAPKEVRTEPAARRVYVPSPPEPTIPPRAPAAEVVRREDKIDILSLLKSPTGLRDAIVLREIFGPPRGLRDVDLIGIA